MGEQPGSGGRRWRRPPWSMRVLSVVKCAHQVRAQLRARPRHRTL